MTPIVIAAVISILLGSFFATLESAAARFPANRLDEMEDQRRKATLQAVLADRSAVVMVLTFLRVLAEAAAAVLVTLAVNQLVDGIVETLAISIGVMLLVSFLLVGVSPRTIGRQRSEAVLSATGGLVLGLRKVLAPVVRLLVLIGNAVTPGKGYRDGPFQTEADLREMVDLAGDSALIEDGERRMLHSVFDLGDTMAREVMVPRTDMITIDRTKSLQQAMTLFSRTGFSRLPVVDGGADQIDGLVFFRDVAREMFVNSASASRPVAELTKPVTFVPDSKRVDELMREMQVERRHFAVVFDEHGGTAGLVTMEDLVEEIVGEIDDEYDRVAPGIEDLGEGVWRVPARMALDDLGEELDIEILEDDVETVGGLLGKTIGRVPIPGAVAYVPGLKLTADRMAGRRHQLATVLVELVPLEDEDAPDADDTSDAGQANAVSPSTQTVSRGDSGNEQDPSGDPGSQNADAQEARR